MKNIAGNMVIAISSFLRATSYLWITSPLPNGGTGIILTLDIVRSELKAAAGGRSCRHASLGGPESKIGAMEIDNTHVVFVIGIIEGRRGVRR